MKMPRYLYFHETNANDIWHSMLFFSSFIACFIIWGQYCSVILVIAADNLHWQRRISGYESDAGPFCIIRWENTLQDKND